MDTKTEKCNKCKCYRLPEEFLNAKNRKLKTCVFCREHAKRYREKSKCPHGKQKAHCSVCKEILKKGEDF